MTRIHRLLVTASTIAVAALGATSAQAAGTASGSTITNTVSVGYSVGGVSQTPVTASNSFTVDRKISLTVAELGSSTTTVSPGQTAAVTKFTVTNTSNAPLDFGLAVAQQVGGAGAHANTDNFDATNVQVFVDSNGNGVYEVGVDTATFIDELAADTSKTVFVVVDIPAGRSTGDVAAVTLTAQARDGGVAGTQGAISTPTSGANTAGVDTVFADTAGATDAARDGQHSAKNDYTVSTAALTVTKVSKIISDPFNGSTNPKMIPGAVVEYCIIVANAAGGSAATNVAISDTLPTQTAGITTSGKINGTATAGVCNADGSTGGTVTATAASATLASVAAGANQTFYFQVTIQ